MVGDDADEDDARGTEARFWIGGGTVALGDSRFPPSHYIELEPELESVLEPEHGS